MYGLIFCTFNGYLFLVVIDILGFLYLLPHRFHNTLATKIEFTAIFYHLHFDCNIGVSMLDILHTSTGSRLEHPRPRRAMRLSATDKEDKA